MTSALVRAALLDFDGVVVASLNAHLDAWDAAAMEVFNRSIEGPEALAGHATRTIAAILAKRFGDPSLARVLAEAKARHLVGRGLAIPLVPGIREWIAELRTQGIPYGIASNSPRQFVQQIVNLHGLEVSHHYIIGGDDIARGKPHPDIYWELANRLGIHPKERSQILVFEDSVHGLKAAISAGMVGIGVTTELPAEELLRAGARAVCADFHDALRRNLIGRA